MSKRLILVIVTLTSFFIPFMSSSINVALPPIGKEFALDAVSLGWIATSFLLALTIFLVPLGRIADIYGRKKVFVAGLGIYTSFSIFCTLSNSEAMFICFRILQGIGGAMIAGTGPAIITSVFPPGERGKALGFNAATAYIGLSLGPILGGFSTDHFGWRSIFLISALVGIAVLILALLKFKIDLAGAKGERFDLGGSIIYAVALLSLMAGFSSLPDTGALWFFPAGIAALLLFIFWETRAKSPIINTKLFRHNITFAFSNLAALINYSATFAVGFLLSLYLQFVKGFTPSFAGTILVSQPLVMAIMSLLAGRLSDKIEPRIVASIGMTLSTIGLLMLSFLGPDTGLWLIIISLIILGVGFAFFSSPNTNAIMSSVENRFYGVAAGTLGTMRYIGQMLSLAVATMLFSIYVGRVQITPEYFPQFLAAFKTAFVVFTVLCFLGVFASLARGKIR